MTRVLGYVLVSFGLAGCLFFFSYKGTAIPLKSMAIALSCFAFIAGNYLMAKHSKKTGKHIDALSKQLVDIAKLRRIGQKVRVTLENAEIKSRNSLEEIFNEEPYLSEIIDGLYDSNRNYKTKEIQQTYIIYYKQYEGVNYMFISQASTQSIDSVKIYLDTQKGVDLYIDPKNPTNYYFDFHLV